MLTSAQQTLPIVLTELFLFGTYLKIASVIFKHISFDNLQLWESGLWKLGRPYVVKHRCKFCEAVVLLRCQFSLFKRFMHILQCNIWNSTVIKSRKMTSLTRLGLAIRSRRRHWTYWWYVGKSRWFIPTPRYMFLYVSFLLVCGYDS